MKKVGILTFFRPINYGAVLQAYASTLILEQKMGDSAELIDYRSPRTEYYRKWFQPREYVKLLNQPVRLVKRVCADVVYSGRYIRRERAFDEFLQHNMNISKRVYYNEEDLRTSEQEYDAYMVGSDLVWNPEMTEESGKIFFLSFVTDPGKLCVSYAASIGVKTLPNKDLDQYKVWLSKFDYISVRESTAADLLQPLTEKTVETVLDPTLLTKGDDWTALFSKHKKIEEKYVLSFMLEYSPVLIENVKQIADEQNLLIVNFDLRNYYGRRKCRNAFDVGPSEFLSLVANAECIITNSFHGCAFSIIFHKELYCIPHTTRGTRMIELLNALDMNERIITQACGCKNHPIDYKSVEEKLDILRQKSLCYLYNAIGGQE